MSGTVIPASVKKSSTGPKLVNSPVTATVSPDLVQPPQLSYDDSPAPK